MYAKELGRREHDLFLAEYKKIKNKFKNSEEVPCFCVDIIKAQQQQGFEDISGAYIGGSFLQAGSEMTSAVLIGFVQAMLIFPEIPKIAQAELDRVCGDRLPDLNDAPHLPYIRCCVKESLRWMPTDILGVPHAVSQDDNYMGYKIPKDSGIVFNVWAIQNDPKRHQNPRMFDPSRWRHDNQTSAEAATNSDVTKRDHFVYGAGRRLCQGMHIADRSLFLAIARLLWAFNFNRVFDEQSGQEIIPDMENLTEGLFVCPEPFKADIVPRDADKAARIREEWAKTAELLDGDMQWKAYPEGLVWKK
ncbi:cytochrome P450 [Camillea tinctor]|nr:cytochrome P450 [Camillea tinctor]